MEAGFPAASDMDFEAVKRLAQIADDNLVISGLARAVEHDIETAVNAISFLKTKTAYVYCNEPV